MGSVGKFVGVFLATVLLVGTWTVLHNKNARDAVIDFSVKNWFSDEDAKAIKDPQAADKALKASLEKEELWKRSPQWQQGWQPPQITIQPRINVDPPKTGTFQPQGWKR